MEALLTDNLTPQHLFPPDFYKKILDQIETGLYFVDRNRHITYWNKGAEEIAGYSADELMGKWCGDGFLNHIDFDGEILCGSKCPLKATIEDGQERTTDVLLQHKSGRRVPVKIKAKPIRNQTGEIIGALESFKDFSPEQKMRQQINELQLAANIDSMTGIANRRYMEQHLELMDFQFRNNGLPYGVIFIDVNNLKMVNDTYGHDAGDELIALVADTLKTSFRAEDQICRWGGDEFVAVLNNVNDETLKKLRDKTRIKLNSLQILLEGEAMQVSTAAGAAISMPEEVPMAVVTRADEAMYADKQKMKRGR